METATLAALRERLCLQGQTRSRPSGDDGHRCPSRRQAPALPPDGRAARLLDRTGRQHERWVASVAAIMWKRTSRDWTSPAGKSPGWPLGRGMDMLRCVITPDGRQRVLPAVPACRIPLEDLSALPEEEKERVLRAETGTAFPQGTPADKAFLCWRSRQAVWMPLPYACTSSWICWWPMPTVSAS